MAMVAAERDQAQASAKALRNRNTELEGSVRANAAELAYFKNEAITA